MLNLNNVQAELRSIQHQMFATDDEDALNLMRIRERELQMLYSTFLLKSYRDVQRITQKREVVYNEY